MLQITVKNDLRLEVLEKKLIQTEPLMEQWRDTRYDIFDSQYDQELDPNGNSLRPLSRMYAEWKRKTHPGRKKRELTQETRKSHKIVLRRNGILEIVQGKGVLLQEHLNLPLLPTEFSNPTNAALMKVTLLYLLDF